MYVALALAVLGSTVGVSDDVHLDVGGTEITLEDASLALETLEETTLEPLAADGTAVQSTSFHGGSWWAEATPGEQAIIATAGTAGGLSLLGFAWMLFSRIRHDELEDHPVRASLREYVESKPGSTRQELRHATDVAWGTVVYHLDRMEDARILVSTTAGGRRRYWVNGHMDREGRRHTAILASETTRRVAEAVQARPGISSGDLSQHLGVGAPTASKHLKRLLQEGLVRAEQKARNRFYYPTDAMARVAAA